ncbi:MAG: GAF domain-containing protein [Streptomycetaceae bacterium]|nr:GAF domain-containing protein [Streptomycetaceae bacterium]
MHEAALTSRRLAARPHPLILESWKRMVIQGMDPDRNRHLGLLPRDEVDKRRESSGLGEVLPAFREGLAAVAENDWHLMVVTDADGRVLWRSGSHAGQRTADRFGLQEGSCLTEEVAGTNAVGTSLLARRPIQVTSAEHYVRMFHSWFCTSAPVHDPRDGRLLGAVDVTGPADKVHPATLALVSAVARVAEGELRSRHLESVERLRSAAAPLLARIGGKAIAVDHYGWTAGVIGISPTDRVALPDSPQTGNAWLPALGLCSLEPLPGGWLVRIHSQETPRAPSRVVLDLRRPRTWSVSVDGAAGSWAQHLSPRHTELLFVLAVHREGRTAAQLAADLFGEPTRTVTIRAEFSRLRRQLAGVLAHRPYRFTDEVDVQLLRPANPLELLPFSTAPAVLAAREAGQVS